MHRPVQEPSGEQIVDGLFEPADRPHRGQKLDGFGSV
jgi:hypothetical protein